MMQKRKTLEQRMDKEIQAKSGLLKNIETVDPLTIQVVPDHHPVYVHADRVSVGFEGQSLFEPVSFDVLPGERVVLVGPNGIGKSSLLEALVDQFPGTVNGTLTHPDLSFSWVRQQNHATGTLKAFAETQHLDYQALLNNLKKLGLERSSFTTPIESLSMGQQNRLTLVVKIDSTESFFTTFRLGVKW